MQYDAPALRNKVRKAIETFRAEMRNISAKAKRANPEHFDEDGFDRELDVYATDMGDRGSAFISLIDEADEALGRAEDDGGLEPGQRRLVPMIDPEFLDAAE